MGTGINSGNKIDKGVNHHHHNPPNYHHNKNNINHKGQVEVTFNWVYILIAGAVILLFFVSLVVRQKSISEQHLAVDVVRILESIITGAQVSEKTKSSIPLGGLSEQTLYFNCEDGVSEYGVVGLPARVQNSFDSVFAPTTIQGSRLILWSLPYALPFKITDFLLVTSDNNHYFFLGEGQGLSDEFIEGAADSKPQLTIQAQKVNSLSEISASGKKVRARIVDADGKNIVSQGRIPGQLLALEDKDLTAVSFTANNEANFFIKEGSFWKKLNLQPVPMVSQAVNRDAAVYGAIFTEDPEIYLCNMQKAYQRIRLISEIYEAKVQELEQHYQSSELNSDVSASCLGFISGFTASEGNVKDTLLLYKTRARACSLLADSSCVEIVDFAERLQDLNERLADECSITLY
ncbi:MAG TPA: hypothetical protein VJH68_03005 [Candidatus Nanoarchaeia archaeon]|nr:hypothetical protein [Candidatus Nanoarchaeia archaeon]